MGPTPFSAGAGDRETGLDGDRGCLSHFPREASREALQAARGGAGKARNVRERVGGFPLGGILGARPWLSG